VPKYFIKGTDVARIDFGPGYKAVLVGGRQLIKPSELAIGYLKVMTN
jgi:hypothetical protein